MSKNSWWAGWGVRVLGLCVGLALLMACDGGGGGGGGGGRFAGNYNGTFSGDDFGTWAVNVDGDGVVSGTARSAIGGGSYRISGDVNVAGRLEAGMYRGDDYSGTFNGAISADGVVGGTWSQQASGYVGTFSGLKQ